jgi:phosphonate transport system substrate-binding protein
MFRFLFLLCISFPLLSFAAADVISIGLLPGGNPKALEQEAYVLGDKLQQKTGKPVQVYISKNYSAMIEALKAKKVDIAVLSSMTYVSAEKELELKVLLKKTWGNSPFYYSAIVTPKNSKIKKLADLKNKTIAFVDEKSTSGYLYPEVYLKKKNMTDQYFKSVVFSGNHSASIEMLENGKVDAAAVFSDDDKAKAGAWNRFAKNKKFQIRPLWISDPIPNDPIVVRQDFYDNNTKLTHEIMYSLIEIQSENHSNLIEILGTSDLMPATSRQYDPVREMVRTFQSAIKL